MNVFGLHTFAVAPTWDLDRIERRIEELKEYGIGLLEVPLLRPEEIDTKASRAFASRWGVEPDSNGTGKRVWFEVVWQMTGPEHRAGSAASTA